MEELAKKNIDNDLKNIAKDFRINEKEFLNYYKSNFVEKYKNLKTKEINHLEEMEKSKIKLEAKLNKMKKTCLILFSSFTVLFILSLIFASLK